MHARLTRERARQNKRKREKVLYVCVCQVHVGVRVCVLVCVCYLASTQCTPELRASIEVPAMLCTVQPMKSMSTPYLPSHTHECAISTPYLPCHTHEWVMSHTWMSHVHSKFAPSHVNESCPRHTWMSHVHFVRYTMRRATRTYESYLTYKRVISHIWMSHFNDIDKSCPLRTCPVITHKNKSCQTYERLIPNMWEKKSCPSYSWVMCTALCTCPVIKQMYEFTHLCLWLGTYGVEMTPSYDWQESFICVTWLIDMCDLIHAYVWHDSFICVTWLIHMHGTTYSYVWHDSCVCVTWLIHVCDWAGTEWM